MRLSRPPPLATFELDALDSAVPSFQPPAGEPTLATANSYLGASH
jgi:hypothetical protein